MTAINRLRTLRYGIHSGANDFTSTPTLAGDLFFARRTKEAACFAVAE